MSDRIGQQLGNYRLTQLLGQGGFADVYLGEHLYLNTKAAILHLHRSWLREHSLAGAVVPQWTDDSFCWL